MGYEFRNKARVLTDQNLIDLAVQEYGTADAIFKLIDLNPEHSLTVNSELSSLVGQELFADNQSEQEIALVKKFSLEGRTVVNDDYQTTKATGPDGDFNNDFNNDFYNN